MISFAVNLDDVDGRGVGEPELGRRDVRHHEHEMRRPGADATDRSWGGRSAFIADPEGNRWEITWSPRATFDARGALLSWD